MPEFIHVTELKLGNFSPYKVDGYVVRASVTNISFRRSFNRDLMGFERGATDNPWYSYKDPEKHQGKEAVKMNHPIDSYQVTVHMATADCRLFNRAVR